MLITFAEFCRNNGKEKVLNQWDYDNNGDLTPEDISYGSHRRVNWVCEKGHRWQAIVKARVEGSGCPVCSGRKVLQGFNDLQTTHPQLASEWHPTKNGDYKPSDAIAGSHRKVWWVCSKKHEWEASICSRVRGVGCPVCSGKKIKPGENDLSTLYPEIAAEWHPTKNDGLTAQAVAPYSNRRVWWQCKLGHEYTAAVSARTMHGSGCPYCSSHRVLPGFNDLASRDPAVAAQWHPTLNKLKPDMVTYGSRKKIWWQCPEGHVWSAPVHSRTGKAHCGCPICSGRVNKTRIQRYADIAREALIKRERELEVERNAK